MVRTPVETAPAARSTRTRTRTREPPVATYVDVAPWMTGLLAQSPRPGWRSVSIEDAETAPSMTLEGAETAVSARVLRERQALVVPAMKASTASWASSSEYCTGGDFMK